MILVTGDFSLQSLEEPGHENNGADLLCHIIEDDMKQPALSINTPSTSVDDDQDPRFTFRVDQCPYEGVTFIIKQRDFRSRGFLAVDDGKVVLADDSVENKGCHWKCVKTNGWFGFRNCVTGNYLGHNNQADIVVQSAEHLSWERVYFLPYKGGGFNLLMPWGESLHAIGWDKDRLRLGSEGLVQIGWEFARVITNKSQSRNRGTNCRN